jgi:predicted nucleic acid-binding protein
MAFAVLDTSVYVDDWRIGLERELEPIRRAFVIRHSAVVLSELRRGARTAAARRLVAALRRLAGHLWVPDASDWWTAGELVRTIGDAQDWEVAKRREFQNDALIALTARRHGAAVVTRNVPDFELLRRRLSLTLVTV